METLHSIQLHLHLLNITYISAIVAVSRHLQLLPSTIFFFLITDKIKQKSYKPSVCYLPSSKEQTGSISIKLVDIVEHLEPKWVGSFPQELMRDIIGLAFFRRPET